MTDSHAPTATRVPAHLWIVGILALVWNAFGATDYVMTRLHNASYMRAMMPDSDPERLFHLIDAMPLYASFGWGLGVWMSLLGTVLLLMRSHHAATAYAVSIVGMALSFGYQLFVPNDLPAEMKSPLMPLLIVAIGLALFAYARAQARRAVLR